MLVSHHVEEIPPGFSHALVLAGGVAVAAGALETVLCDEVLSRAYDLPITVEWRDGRAWARKTRRQVTRDTRMSHRAAMMHR